MDIHSFNVNGKKATLYPTQSKLLSNLVADFNSSSSDDSTLELISNSTRSGISFLLNIFLLNYLLQKQQYTFIGTLPKLNIFNTIKKVLNSRKISNKFVAFEKSFDKSKLSSKDISRFFDYLKSSIDSSDFDSRSTKLLKVSHQILIYCTSHKELELVKSDLTSLLNQNRFKFKIIRDSFILPSAIINFKSSLQDIGFYDLAIFNNVSEGILESVVWSSLRSKFSISTSNDVGLFNNILGNRYTLLAPTSEDSSWEDSTKEYIGKEAFNNTYQTFKTL